MLEPRIFEVDSVPKWAESWAPETGVWEWGFCRSETCAHHSHDPVTSGPEVTIRCHEMGTVPLGGDNEIRIYIAAAGDAFGFQFRNRGQHFCPSRTLVRAEDLSESPRKRFLQAAGLIRPHPCPRCRGQGILLHAAGPPATRWLLNSAVIAAGGYGEYRYSPATKEELREFLAAGPYCSRIGYPETADQIEAWTGVRPALSRELSEMALGDVAMIVRLRYRVADPTTKGQGVPDEAWEIARLERLS